MSSYKTTNPLDVLAYAISDVGIWTWYKADLPFYLQLEFNGAMLYQKPKRKDLPPANKVALQFLSIYQVFQLQNSTADLPVNWLEQFTVDQLTPFNLNHEQFTFDQSKVVKMLQSADRVKCIHGANDRKMEDLSDQVILGFRAGPVGMVIVAQDVHLVTHNGEIPLKDIPAVHQQWWNYWKQYWAVKDTDEALPYDTLCEITIPAGS